MAPVRSPRASSLGTTPAVETVIRRREMPIPSLSEITSRASATASRLYRGSPMPMKTMLVSRRSPGGAAHSARSSRATWTWATISAAVRLRTSAWVPVWQKVQLSVQPTWLETQRAPERPTSGMNTVSASTPGAKAISHLITPSPLSWRSTILGRSMVNRLASSARASLAMLLMGEKSVTPALWIHRHTCPVRIRASAGVAAPPSTRAAESWARFRPARLTRALGAAAFVAGRARSRMTDTP